MPAVVQHLAGLVDSLRRRLGRRDARRARHPDARRARQLRRAGQDGRRAHAGGRRRRHDRDGVGDRGAAHRGDRRAARHPAARRDPRQPGLPGEGLRHADGRRPAAVRRRRRAAFPRCWPSSRTPTSSSSASTSSPARRTSTPRSSARRSARPSSSRCGWPTTSPTPVTLPQPRWRVRHPVLREGPARSTWPRSAQNLAELLTRRDPPAAARRTRRGRARPLHRRRVRRLRHARRRPQGVARQDLPRRRRRPAPPARRVRQLRPGDPPQLSGGDRRPQRRRGRPRRSASSAACARRSTCSATDAELPRAERRRPRRRLPGRRLRPDRQPDGLSRATRHRPRCWCDHRQPRGTHGNSAPTVEDVKAVLVETLGIEDRAASIDATTPLLGSLPELDSMAVLELVIALEERFDIVVEDDDVTAEVFETLDSLDGVRRRQAARDSMSTVLVLARRPDRPARPGRRRAPHAAGRRLVVLPRAACPAGATSAFSCSCRRTTRSA